MLLNHKRLILLLAVMGLTQVACYNTYFIDKDELEKLESQVEQQEVVMVYGDCPKGASAQQGGEDADPSAYRSVQLDGSMWAAADDEEPATASDATGTSEAAEPGRAGCERVPVSTANAMNVVTEDGESFRVTPFNFMMSQQQLVSPEYDLLLSLDEVEGGEVREFSTWKTVGTIAGVSAVAVGTFVAVTLLAPDGDGFSQ
jgi:hypothetical protein